MESSQLERPKDQGHAHTYYEEEQQLPRRGGVVRSSVVEEEQQAGGGDQDHHEKKSVLKKVKAKAKKIKDTITHHGHLHGHEHDRDDEESLEDDEMDEDPNVHGGQIGGDRAGAISSTAIYHKTLDDFGHVENPAGVNPTNPNEDHYGSGLKDEEDRNRETTGGISRVPLHKHQPFVSETNPSSGHPGGELFQPAGGIKIGAPVGLEEDPHAPSNRPMPPSNYESKTFDPTRAGGEEARINPLVHAFEKMDVGGGHDIKPEQNIKPESQKLYTGSHDQFAPEPIPSNVYMSAKDTESIPKSFDPSKPEDLPCDPIDGKPSQRAGAIQETQERPKKASTAEYAKGATIIVADKLAPVYEKVAGAGSAVMEKLPIGKSEGAGEGKGVTTTVKEKLSPVYDKVASAGSSLMSKVQGPGTGQEIVREGNEETREGNDVRADKGVSIKEYLAEKLKPREEDRALSDMISGTLSRQKTEETGEPKPPMGKVTESEEVARRLGSMDDRPREGSEQKGMVDMLKGAVNSWLGRDNKPQTNERNEVSQAGEVHNQNVMGEERRLQESGH